MLRAKSVACNGHQCCHGVTLPLCSLHRVKAALPACSTHRPRLWPPRQIHSSLVPLTALCSQRRPSGQTSSSRSKQRTGLVKQRPATIQATDNKYTQTARLLAPPAASSAAADVLLAPVPLFSVCWSSNTHTEHTHIPPPRASLCPPASPPRPEPSFASPYHQATHLVFSSHRPLLTMPLSFH